MLALLLVILAALCLLPLAASRFYVYLAALMLVTGLFASSLNIVLGFGGMYQFHHAGVLRLRCLRRRADGHQKRAQPLAGLHRGGPWPPPCSA